MTLLVCVGLFVSSGGCNTSKDPSPQRGEEATTSLSAEEAMRKALAAKEWTRARELGLEALIATPNDPDLLAETAVATAMCGMKRDAASLLSESARAANFDPASRVNQAVQAHIDVGELYEAIDLLEQVLRTRPENTQHRRILVSFLGEAQRADLIAPHYENVVKDRNFDLPFLVGMTDMSTRRFSSNTAESMMERNPEDHRVRLAEAQTLLENKEFEAAEKVLREILEHHPRFAVAHALLGQVLVADGRESEVPDWFPLTQPGSRELSLYWLTLGDWASFQSLHAAAARAYWEATVRDVNNSKAWSRLADTLRILKTNTATSNGEGVGHAVSDLVLEDCDRRVQNLLELRQRLERFSGSNEQSQRVAVSIAEVLHLLGRNWEAEAWTAVATTLTEDEAGDLNSTRAGIVNALKNDRDWISKRGHPALTLDLSDLPIPVPGEEEAVNGGIDQLVLPESDDTSGYRLVDETELRGLVVSHPIEASTVPSIIHSLGCGGGTIDFNLDGAADLMLAGAGGTMRERNSAANLLFQNFDGAFVDRTRLAGVGDTGLCQGIVVGDFNEDGFPDVFLANVGENRLLRNNGDGTFSDATDLLPDDSGQWTTCGAFVDLSRDGIADLVSVNYCDADSPIDQPCFDAKRKRPIVCHPVDFPAQSDELLQGSASGRFVDVASDWLDEVPKGRGLGILAGALDGRNLGVLVVNDLSANQLYTRPQPTKPIQEMATVRGVAVDARMKAQGSMGIASGDFDGDGDLDFFVTGFAREYNIYYRQESPGYWRDDTARQGLVEPSLMTVGFGTEAIDMEGDGIEELVVTNGHTGDFGEASLPHAQRFQLFRRSRSGRFSTVDVSQWCSYLASPHVGRALWTLDADGDGRRDIVITHENEPPRLLVNRTESTSSRLTLWLVGTRDSRDGAGAVVRFECGGRRRSLWALSGDGYMCSNERALRAGLGSEKSVQNLVVTWPDGTVDSIGQLRGDAEYLVVQGTGEAFAFSQ